MSHHSSDEPFDSEDFEARRRRNKLLRSVADVTKFRGAIGSFPDGHLTPSDEGAVQFAVGEHDGKVVIDFGTPVHWLGMTPQQAADLASTLLKKAREVGRKTGVTVAISL